MKQLFLISFYFCIYSCSSDEKQDNQPATQPKRYTQEQAFQISYDITDLTTYKNNRAFIGRAIISKKYNKQFVIELTEFDNTTTLCVKEPFLDMKFNYVDSNHSIPFNQRCYILNPEEAKDLKSNFLKYKRGTSKTELSCPGCLDPEYYTIEVFDRGQYSYITRDFEIAEDTAFLDGIIKRVHLDKKFGYKIDPSY